MKVRRILFKTSCVLVFLTATLDQDFANSEYTLYKHPHQPARGQVINHLHRGIYIIQMGKPSKMRKIIRLINSYLRSTIR